MPIIIQMDQRLANMIAAGEVVDRPASVIKELIENAIDAQSTKILVDIFDMGMSKMVVTDNGVGMDQVDARLAFSRHATSKIKDEYDLSHIKTLGFRGEALAAIASVSKVILKTRQKDSQGFMVQFEGGHFIKEGLASLNQGTIVEVSDLFYNTPARFKYIKSDIAEKMQIIDIFDRLALAHPEIAFQLTMDGKKIKETYGNRHFTQLIDQIYGQRMTKGMVEFHEVVQKIKVNGYLLAPSIARSRKKDISIFVNGRYIKNYALVQAVIDGYHSYMMVGKYPIALIHIEMDPSLLDVNVHPQKYEIKFVNEMVLAFHIEGFVKKTLSKEIYDIVKPLEQETIAQTQTFERIQMSFNEPIKPIEIEAHAHKQIVRIPHMDYVGTFSGTYLLFQNEEGLFLVDQHAAAERVRYEHYMITLKKPSFARKMMLMPHSLTITDTDNSLLETYKESFRSYGFIFNDQYELIEIPSWLHEDEIDLSIEAMLSMLQTHQTIDLGRLRDTLAKDISCKGAIKANKSLSLLEIEHLISSLRACENPYHCPHGRPTIIKLTHYDIERMFKRVV